MFWGWGAEDDDMSKRTNSGFSSVHSSWNSLLTNKNTQTITNSYIASYHKWKNSQITVVKFIRLQKLFLLVIRQQHCLMNIEYFHRITISTGIRYHKFKIIRYKANIARSIVIFIKSKIYLYTFQNILQNIFLIPNINLDHRV